MLLGCIADDFTGATDLANNLVRTGMRVVQAIGVPEGTLADVDAVVIALKSRTVPKDAAVAQSLQALRWLRSRGARQIYFKYCSTFDSTPEGNIGPVTEALMDAMADVKGADFTIATPAFPDNQRTVFKGHLFVGDVPLQESGMQNHPLTPMTDSNLVRVLQAQCRRKVGLIDYKVVAQGETAIRARIDALRAGGVTIAVVDAISNDDLLRLGPALAEMPLVTAGSGVAIGLAANFGIAPSSSASALPKADGAKAIVSGSCSLATNRQVRAFVEGGGCPRSRRAADRRRCGRRRKYCGRPRDRAGDLCWSIRRRRCQSEGRATATRRRAADDGRAHAGGHRARPCWARSAAAHRRRRRNGRCLRAGARRHADAHRSADRPRRAVVSRRGARHPGIVASGVEVGQLRRRRFFTRAFGMLA
jgi:hypothetical protein